MSALQDTLVQIIADIHARVVTLAETAPLNGVSAMRVMVNHEVLRHPLAHRYVKALWEDDGLGGLWRPGPIRPHEMSEWDYFHMIATKQFYATTGSGFGSQMIVVASELLYHAYCVCYLASESPTQESCIQVAEAVVAKLRQLVRGKEIMLPALIGFQHIHMGETTRLDMPWGTIMRMTPRQQNVLASPKFEDFVLLTQVPFRLYPIADGASFNCEWQKRGMQTEETLSEYALKTSLAVGLGLPDHVFEAPAISWWTTLSVIGGPMMGMPQKGISLTGPYTLDSHDVERIRAIVPRVDQCYMHLGKTTVRRWLMALTARTDPEDRLVNAMISLEALFGSGAQGEITFRISSAVSWLLGNNFEERQDLFKKTKALYGNRSQVVHGGGSKKARTVDAAYQASVLVTQCLRVLFHDWPTLLSDSQRGQSLSLGKTQTH